MIRAIALVPLALAQVPIGTAAAACAGATPTVASVSLQNVTPSRYLNYYHVTARVTNRGSEAKPSNVLQFVDVVQYGDRLDDRGIPPLAAGQSYTIVYVWKRAVDAGKWTTPLDFRIRPVSPMPAGSENCSTAPSSITF
jgi:hypothetical protein